MRCLFAAAVALSAHAAQQIHLSLTGIPTEMHVSWADADACSHTSDVEWGETTALGHKITIKGSTFSEAKICLYEYTIQALKANTKYYYKVGKSSMYSFVNQPVRDGGKIYAVYADFGLGNDVSITQLVAEAQHGKFDAVIHAGDWAYNLEDNGGATGNDFMNAIEPIAAVMPYMGSPGNHESDGNTFAQYRARLSAYNAAANTSDSNSLMWYSFNDGLVHWYSIDTELWAYGGKPAEIQAQYNWLTKDLANVDRSVTPWVIGFGHKQRWMDSVNFTGLDPIITAGKTDLYFCGHQHNYQRLYPTSADAVEKECVSADGSLYQDCKLPIIIVAGSPGCREQISGGLAPDRDLVKKALAYGYGHLTVVNSTHIHWEWEETGQRDMRGEFMPKAGAVADEAWVVKRA